MSAPIVSSDIERDDTETLTHIGRVYWFPQYAVQDEIEELKRKAFRLFEDVS